MKLGEFLNLLIDFFSLFWQEREERQHAGRKGRSFSFNRENSDEKEKKKLLGVPAVTSISQQLNSFINVSTQVGLSDRCKVNKEILSSIGWSC